MPSLKRNSLPWLCSLGLCLTLVCCQKMDVPAGTESEADTREEAARIVGTGEGTRERPYTVTDIRSSSLTTTEPVWVVGYMVGTAPRSMTNASFSIDADNQSNILLSSDSLCTDPGACIPVELSSSKNKSEFSLPSNKSHFRQCLLLKALPSQYLYGRGLRNISTGLWLDGFDIASVAPQEWGEWEI